MLKEDASDFLGRPPEIRGLSTMADFLGLV